MFPAEHTSGHCFKYLYQVSKTRISRRPKLLKTIKKPMRKQ